MSAAAIFGLAAAVLIDPLMTAAVLAAVAAHECGHLMALRLFGHPAASLQIELWGLTICTDRPLGYLADIVAAASGPIASVVFSVGASLLGRVTGIEALYIAAGMSLVFAAFNALPVAPLDGGRVLSAALSLLAGPDAATRVVCVVSCAVIFALLTGGAVLFIQTRSNFTLLAAAVWLLVSYCQTNRVRLKLKRN